MKRAALLLVLLIACAVAGISLVFYSWNWNAFGGYDASLPLKPEISAVTSERPFHAERIEITGLQGERLPFRLIVPETGGAPVPCVVLLYGIGQNINFFDRVAPIFAEHGVAMAIPEQFEQGVRRTPGSSLYRRAKAFHTRSSRIVPETRRVVDYLVSRPEIDANRLHLFGVSYGGIMSSAVLVQEPRFKTGSLIMAGGDLKTLLKGARHSLRTEGRVAKHAGSRDRRPVVRGLRAATLYWPGRPAPVAFP